jgi:hypothetical protein
LASDKGQRFFIDPDREIVAANRRIIEERRSDKLQIDNRRFRSRIVPFLADLPRRISHSTDVAPRHVAPKDKEGTIARARARGYASAADLSRIFGQAYAAWAKRCEGGLFPDAVRTTKDSKTSWRIGSASLEAIAAVYEASLTHKETARYLGIAEFQIVALENLGLLDNALADKSQNFQRYLPESIEHVISLLQALSTPIPEGLAKRDLVPLAWVYDFERRKRACRSWTERMAMIFSGKHPVFQVDASLDRGFNAFATTRLFNYGRVGEFFPPAPPDRRRLK